MGKISKQIAFYLITLSLLNIAYVAIEIYKAKIAAPLLDKTSITKEEFYQIHELTNYANICEGAFLIISIVWTVSLFLRRYKPHFTQHIFIQFIFLILLFVFNRILSILTGALPGDMTQLLYGPFIISCGALLYFMVPYLMARIKKY